VSPRDPSPDLEFLPERALYPGRLNRLRARGGMAP
jgi:hypothetical protein